MLNEHFYTCWYRDTSVTSAIKHLREHQKKLQASSNRIEEMLKQLTETQKVNEATATKHIPRALSVSVLFILILSLLFRTEDYP